MPEWWRDAVLRDEPEPFPESTFSSDWRTADDLQLGLAVRR